MKIFFRDLPASKGQKITKQFFCLLILQKMTKKIASLYYALLTSPLKSGQIKITKAFY